MTIEMRWVSGPFGKLLEYKERAEGCVDEWVVVPEVMGRCHRCGQSMPEERNAFCEECEDE